ncbi:MAG: tRNA (cytosine(32)/uridine(32)-2'-O)-methyltransferase TrmJ, partial [Pseudomonadota bacterium]|nr:tRNA (cytosine(32)/uridine(32)-2'-O)-methyltransferase TrmJ [Pseudomonadota bacterium]
AAVELDPRAAAARLAQASGQVPVALVFGRERSGLTNDELDRCHFQVCIPADPAYPSLNLAAAVQVLAYELRMAHRQAPPQGVHRAAAPPASAQDLERCYVHLEQVLREIGFLDPANPRQLMRRLRRLFNRAQPDANEVNILRGILSAVQKRPGDPGR